LKCNLVLAYNTPAALAVKAAAPSMPLVFSIGGDPVALGLVESLARPGGLATRVTTLGHEAGVKKLNLLKEVVPAARRVAVMFEAANPTMLHAFDATMAAARRADVALRAFELRDWKTSTLPTFLCRASRQMAWSCCSIA
jgi:putative ABC transport system substrate-binding protein